MDPADHLLEGLNPAQREAVTHGEGPLLVLAGAGSGKTRVLTHRIACLLASGRARPSEILAITFTNKAADEMRERVATLVGGDLAGDVGDDLPLRLRADPARRGPAARLHAHLHDLRRGRLACGWSSAASRSSTSTRSASRRARSRAQISAAKNQLRRPERLRGRGRHRLRGDDRRRLRALRAPHGRASNAMDFDDLLMRTVNLLELFPEVRDSYRRHLPLRARRRVPGHQPRPVPPAAAADRRAPQPVRGRRRRPVDLRFRGADIRNILDFEHDFPDADTVIKLEQNYRSTQTILDAANAVVANNRDRSAKNLWTDGGARRPDRGRASSTTSTPRRASSPRRSSGSSTRASPRDEIAVFYRTNAQSRVLEDMLVRFDDPLPGHRRHEVLRARRDQGRDRLPAACSSTPPTRSRSRGSSTRPRRGIGQTAAGAAARAREHARRRRAGRARRAGAASRASAPPRCKAVGRFAETMAALRERAERRGPSPSCSRRPARDRLLEALEAERTIEAEGRIENLEELVGVAREFDANRELEGESDDAAGGVPRSRSRCSPSRTTCATTRASSR